MAGNPHPRLENLKPFKKGQIANPKGRPKGIRNWSTIIQSLLADVDLMDKVVKNKPSYWNDIEVKNGANLIVVAMMIKAMQGDKQAAEWLSKTGFKEQIDVTTNGESFRTIVEIVGADFDEHSNKIS